jgi:hypothetical protein
MVGEKRNLFRPLPQRWDLNLHPGFPPPFHFQSFSGLRPNADGKILLYRVGWLVCSIRLDRPWYPRPAITAQEMVYSARFSPDGRWVVYSVRDASRYEIYAQPFASDGRVAQPPDGRRRRPAQAKRAAPLASLVFALVKQAVSPASSAVGRILLLLLQSVPLSTVETVPHSAATPRHRTIGAWPS